MGYRSVKQVILFDLPTPPNKKESRYLNKKIPTSVKVLDVLNICFGCRKQINIFVYVCAMKTPTELCFYLPIGQHGWRFHAVVASCRFLGGFPWWGSPLGWV
jgi:hypothetical protein